MRLLLPSGASADAATRVGPKPAARPPGAGGGSHGVGIVRGGVPPQGEQAPAPGGMTPLLFAARDGRLDAAKLLVEAGADVNRADPNGITPLLMAITNGQLPVAQFLVERGADVKAADWYGRTPLWAAVEIRNLDLRSDATDNGVDRDAALQLMTTLIDKGADVNARVKEFPPARRYMLPLGSLEWVDITGQTAFTRAAQSADLEAMRLLLAKGADPTHHHVQRHQRADAGRRRELGDRADLRQPVARGGAAVPRARLRRERGQPDGAGRRARRGQSRLGRRHRAARDAAAPASTCPTRKGGRR